MTCPTQVKADEAAALQRREIALAAQLEAARLEVYAGREALRLKQLELDSAAEAAAERRRAAEQEAEELAQERQKRQRTEEDMKVKPSCMQRCHELFPEYICRLLPVVVSKGSRQVCGALAEERGWVIFNLQYCHGHLSGDAEASICGDVCLQAKIAKLAAGGPGAQSGSSAQAWEVENMRERLYCQVCMRLL